MNTQPDTVLRPEVDLYPYDISSREVAIGGAHRQVSKARYFMLPAVARILKSQTVGVNDARYEELRQEFNVELMQVRPDNDYDRQERIWCTVTVVGRIPKDFFDRLRDYLLTIQRAL